MISASLASAVSSAAATFLLAAAVRQLARLRKDVRAFMREHLWLLANVEWSRRTIQSLMHELGLNGDPPPEWPARKE